MGGAREQNDDIDFFGEAEDEEEIIYSDKKNKGSDPLAFLKRAEKEKKQIAERNAMRDAEASAAWKQTSELHYNLHSQFMDTQDKWRQSLGSEIYKV